MNYISQIMKFKTKKCLFKIKCIFCWKTWYQLLKKSLKVRWKKDPKKIMKLMLSADLVKFVEFVTILKGSVARFSRKSKAETHERWGVSQLFLHIAKLLTTHPDSLEEWFMSELWIIQSRTRPVSKYYRHWSNIIEDH